jgi:glyoxylase-like metal-dependent hydrolase (beta-lactamase superfamily II)
MSDQRTEFPIKLAEGLWVLGNSFFNLYLVKGEQASALIEVGVSATVETVTEQLTALGVTPTFLVVTHPHADHVTGLPGLKETFADALAVAGEGAPEFLAHPKAGPAIVEEDRHMSEFLHSRGLQPGRPPLEEAPVLADCLIAREGDEMDLGGLTLRYLSIEGHAPGNINVYIPELEALVASDSLGFRFVKKGFYPIFFMGFDAYIGGMDRLRDLRPKILCVAHQGPLTGDEAETAFEQARQTAVEMRDRIVNDPRDRHEIQQDLFKECYNEEFLLYSAENISNCCKLLVKRAVE